MGIGGVVQQALPYDYDKIQLDYKYSRIKMKFIGVVISVIYLDTNTTIFKSLLTLSGWRAKLFVHEKFAQ